MEGTSDEGGFWEGGREKKTSGEVGGIWKIGRDPSKSAQRKSGEGMVVGKQALSSPNRTMELFPAARQSESRCGLEVPRQPPRA